MERIHAFEEAQLIARLKEQDGIFFLCFANLVASVIQIVIALIALFYEMGGFHHGY